MFYQFTAMFSIFHIVSTISLRNDDNSEFTAMFANKQAGRLRDILLQINNLQFRQCLFNCMTYLKCKAVNYNEKRKICELARGELREENTSQESWLVFGTVADSEIVSYIQEISF